MPTLQRRGRGVGFVLSKGDWRVVEGFDRVTRRPGCWVRLVEDVILVTRWVRWGCRVRFVEALVQEAGTVVGFVLSGRVEAGRGGEGARLWGWEAHGVQGRETGVGGYPFS